MRELDVTRQDSIDRAVAATRDGEGPIDVLVNNAGIGGATPLELTPEAEHRAMFEANYWGPIRMIQAVLPSMRERRTGCIVNVTSIAGRVATPNQIAYSASKHALAAASEALAHEVAAFGVRVAIIEPGVIQTAIFENSAPRHPLRQDLAVPADHAPQRQALRGRLPQPGQVGDRRGDDPRRDHHRPAPAALPGRRRRGGPGAGRARISDEEWVAMGGELSDEEYNARFKRYFGIEL